MLEIQDVPKMTLYLKKLYNKRTEVVYKRVFAEHQCVRSGISTLFTSKCYHLKSTFTTSQNLCPTQNHVSNM